MKHVVMIWLLLSVSGAQAKTIRLNIQTAIRQKLVNARVESLGGHRGFCLDLKVKNLTKDSLIILVEAGTRMIAGDAREQDILLVKEETLKLRGGQDRAIQLKGYCCQASDRSPAVKSRFEVGGRADSALWALARRFSDTPFDGDIEQQAVWAISDRRSTASIPLGDDSCARELRKFVSLLKNEPVPWYATEVFSHIYSNGVIEQFATYVSGSLTYISHEECYSTFMVLDSAGQKVAFIKQQWLKPGAGQQYHFRVPVGGLAKGRYYVQLSGKGTILVRKEFDI